jgi:ribosomal protein S12 methylthiotransferase
MGRLEGQLPEAVKQARVEELMLTQQGVAFAKAQSMKGTNLEVLIDRPAGRDPEDGWVARSRSQAPDIDSVVFVHSDEPLHAGQLVNVKVTDFQAYDLVAEVPKKKSRGLKVLRA